MRGKGQAGLISKDALAKGWGESPPSDSPTDEAGEAARYGFRGTGNGWKQNNLAMA